jgi:hypothetical protein
MDRFAKPNEVWGFNQAYTVIYWDGGSEVGTWKEAGTFKTEKDAWKQANEIVHEGRPAYPYDRYQLMSETWPTEPPKLWDFSNLKWITV